MSTLMWFLCWTFYINLQKAETLKWLACALWIGVHVHPFTWTCSRTEFYQFVDTFVQQINYARHIKGVAPLKLEIDDYILTVKI